MNYFLIILGASLLIVFFFYLFIKAQGRKLKPSSIERFKKKFKARRRINEKYLEGYSNSLMLDPEKNIQIGIWDTEESLREKADIHRARLNKYGRSKMNGTILFLGTKGGVYKLTPKGNKKYV